jgi:GR25 family glycosyltransferase involved in LPS biosynthesis
MDNSLKCIIICQVSSERGASAISRAKELGINYEICPAVFPEGDLPWSKHYNHPRRIRNNGYGMTKGEVGCCLAHREVWKKIVDGNDEKVLVLEDDAEINPAN